MGAEYGSDLVVRILGDLGVEQVFLNPGATTRGIHDSLVNPPGAAGPAPVLTTHEEIAVAAAHGHAKATGGLGVALVHDIVGLLHASMAIFNAFIDQAPVVILGGTGPRDADRRRPWIDWIHSAATEAEAVRPFVKWDVTPTSHADLQDALVRAFRVAATPPHGPVYVAVDVALAETLLDDAFEHLEDSARDAAPPVLPTAPPAEVESVASRITAASFPLLVAERLGGSPGGYEALVALAEASGAPVVDLGMRLNFPTRHSLNVSFAAPEALERADFVLGLDVADMAAVLQPAHWGAAGPRPEAEVVRVGLTELSPASWAEAYRQLVPGVREIAADPVRFTREVAALLEPGGAGHRRGDPAAWASARRATAESQWDQAAVSTGDAAPVTPARLAAAVWRALGEDHAVLVNGSLAGWALRLWDLDVPFQALGHSGGGGLGYGIGASLGAALAHRASGTICVDLQADGDLMYAPGALWSAARLGVPLLVVMFNNRSYHHDELHQREIAGHRSRPVDPTGAGTSLAGPDIDYAALAISLGVAGFGPVTVSADLPDVLDQALRVVRAGGPALVDVVTSPR